MLQGKNIVITGAASGIGKRTAELALSMGANVYCVDRNQPDQDSGQFLQADLGTQQGVDVLIEHPDFLQKRRCCQVFQHGIVINLRGRQSDREVGQR